MYNSKYLVTFAYKYNISSFFAFAVHKETWDA